MDFPATRLDAPIRPRPAGCAAPLACNQLQIWKARSEGGSFDTLRGCLSTVRLTGAVDVRLLRMCIEQIVSRHESLRTTFAERDDVAQQLVNAPSARELQIVEVAPNGQCSAEEAVATLCEEFIREPVDLRVGPLFAARLYHIAATDHVLLCAADHMIADDVSLRVIEREIWTLYGSVRGGSPPELPPVPIHFADYALWQQATRKEWLRQNELYWKDRLTGAPPLRLPGSPGTMGVAGAQGATRRFSFGRKLSEQLRELARQQRTLVSLVVLSVYVAVVSRWCEQRDVVLTFVSTCRNRPELRSVVGYFANLLYLRVSASERDTFAQLLAGVVAEVRRALVHEDFGRVPEFLPEWYYGATEPYFNWIPRQSRRVLTGNPIVDEELQITSFALSLASSATFLPVFSDEDGEIRVHVQHIPALYPDDVVGCFLDNLRLFAERFVADPQAKIGAYRRSP